MSIGKKDAEGFGPVTVRKDFTYREYPVEMSKAATDDQVHWVIYARAGGFTPHRPILAEGPAESGAVALARIRALIDAEHARAGATDGSKHVLADAGATDMPPF